MSGLDDSGVLESDGAGKATFPTQCPPSVNEKTLVRKMDFKILPMLFIVYVAAFLDRRVDESLPVICVAVLTSS